NSLTYPAQIEMIDRNVAGFERAIGPSLPPFGSTEVIPGKGTSHLRVVYKTADERTTSDLIVTGPGGGYIAEEYALFHITEDGTSKITQSFIRPFRFLRLALGDTLHPIPGVTTLNGRRIFYSHIDGDGWNNISETPEYNARQALSAEVILKELL